MPAFSFEKISPPRRGPIAPIVKKQRGLVVAILDRFVEARVKRDEKRVARTQAEDLIHPRSSRLLQPSILRCRSGTSPRAR